MSQLEGCDPQEAAAEPQRLVISHASDGAAARRAVRQLAATLGFDNVVIEELALVVTELASNLVKHAGGGLLRLTPCHEASRIGLRIETLDSGPGIPDVEQAMADGYSTSGSLGYGLGTIHRLTDTCDVTAQGGSEHGTHLVCTRWLRERSVPEAGHCPLDFGAATRPYPGQKLNGDAFVLRRWASQALVAVIDGLGHGQHAHRASQAARAYVERHGDQPLGELFRGVGRACRATRGVVMAVARFDWDQQQVTLGSVGNVEIRGFGLSSPLHLMVRRGILGSSGPDPRVTECAWDPAGILVLHSDGLTTRWSWEDIRHLADASATTFAQGLLRLLAKPNDDATVVVVRGAA